AQVVVDLVTDADADRIGVIEIGAIEITDEATGTLVKMGATQIGEGIADIAAQVPAARLGDLHRLGNRLLDRRLVEIRSEGGGTAEHSSNNANQDSLHGLPPMRLLL